MHPRRAPDGREVRLRLGWLALLAAAGIVGWTIRFGGLVPPSSAKYGGDAAWAAAWMYAILVLRPRWPIGRAALASAGLCFAIEAFQATGVPAGLARYGPVVRFFLGTTFGWWEFPAYAGGVVLAAVLAAAVRRGSLWRTCPRSALPPCSERPPR